MKKLLTSTALIAIFGGASLAEITVSGDAKFGVDHDSAGGGYPSTRSGMR